MSPLSLSSTSPARFGARIGGSAAVWVPRLLSLAVWSAVAGSAVYWVLSLSAAPQPVPSHARVTDADAGLRGDLARLFGERAAGGAPGVAAAAPPPAASSRFKVLGVVGSVRGGSGVALLSIDGRAPRAYRVGAAVDADWIVQSVTQKAVRLAPNRGGAAAFDLELAALPPAATGQLPGVGAESGAPGLPTLPQGGLPTMPGRVAPQAPMGVPPQVMQSPVQIAPPQVPQMRPDGTVVPPDPVASAPGV